jgi:FlaA1/EpsC-like NDP-sugar epimerase
LVGMDPEHVTCVDWWENGTFLLSQELGHSDSTSYRIADVKNTAAMTEIFAESRPQIIFHAAAYKHVPLMQANPLEAINNNVGGSLNLMRLAIEHDSFVYVSTDKAVNPVNVMGATKRIGEMLMLAVSKGTHTKFTAVRFGNVIESNGSVMQIFRRQIASHSPLTVTHEEVTRYFMTIDEASQLIIQSALLGKNGEIFVLDMGEPVKILDLAKSLVRAVDPTLSIEITGMRPGEKMFEELSYEPALVDTTQNAKIFVMRDADERLDTTHLVERVSELLASAHAYSISTEDALEALRALGFDIQHPS